MLAAAQSIDSFQGLLRYDPHARKVSMSANEIKESVLDRIAIIEFLRKSLECDAPWMDTIVLTKLELMTTFAKEESFKRRAKVYNVLGLSLGNVLDKRQMHFMDFLYAVTLVTQETEAFTLKEVLPKANFTAQTKKEKTKKSLFSKTGEEFALLQIPHFAFQPDYYQILFSLLDILHEVHIKIMSYFGNTNALPRDMGVNVNDAYNKFNLRIKKLLTNVQRDIELLAKAKINRELNRVMSGLIVDRGALDRQNKQPGSASFGYFGISP